MAGNLYYPHDVGANGSALRLILVYDYGHRLEWMATQVMLKDKNITHWPDEDYTNERLVITAEVFSQTDINELLNIAYEALNVK